LADLAALLQAVTGLDPRFDEFVRPCNHCLLPGEWVLHALTQEASARA
jgi:hypothetical protein